jgi:hypothetical protein
MSPEENKPNTELVSKNNQDMSPNDLYYMENGFLVFTEKFHLRRGYCCGNGCRHCPYGKKKFRL